MAIKKLPSTGDMPRSTGVPESLVPGGAHDSAGFTWEGRTFDHHGTAFADDTGETPGAVSNAIAAVRDCVAQLAEEGDAEKQASLLATLAEAHANVVAVCSGERFLVPLITEAGDFGLTPEGKVVEKSQELSIVTVKAPDGRGAMPVFTSVAAMQAWNAESRPIPVPGAQVALAAAQEETDLVIIDPGQEATEFAVRRPLLEAFALGTAVLPSWADPEVQEAFAASVTDEPHVRHVVLAPGDPAGRLRGPETSVGLVLEPGLDQQALQELLGRLQERWAADERIAHSVDAIGVKLHSA
ncbi:SseB family protein [Leucobacter sp. UCMA 4100]|uniref:SseB family protein n=1 Tax=Leucobacter sp. UCMA 4100 TaxID=2810534 RepID=UPI0022EA2D1E|nr:SseB family protein [Leucobacter sp. UCMA 4100]MDA3147922.1 SseB family protein [Leucobacter sp. UCMA 4100]